MQCIPTRENNNYDQIGPLSFTVTVVQATVVVLCSKKKKKNCVFTTVSSFPVKFLPQLLSIFQLLMSPSEQTRRSQPFPKVRLRDCVVQSNLFG